MAMLGGAIEVKLRLRQLLVKIGEVIPGISKLYFLVFGLVFGGYERQSEIRLTLTVSGPGAPGIFGLEPEACQLRVAFIELGGVAIKPRFIAPKPRDAEEYLAPLGVTTRILEAPRSAKGQPKCQDFAIRWPWQAAFSQGVKSIIATL